MKDAALGTKPPTFGSEAANGLPTAFRDLRQFGSVDRSGTVSAQTAWDAAVTEYLNVVNNAVLYVPPGDYLLDDTIAQITATGATIVTEGRGVTGLIMSADATTARIFDLEGAGQVIINEFDYSYEDDAADSEAVIRLGDVSECEVRGGRVNAAAGAVLFDDGGGRNMAFGMRGSIDLTKGGNWFENRGQVGWKVILNHMNAGGTDGAYRGGGMIVIKPNSGKTADGGHILFNELQGANSQGTDWGVRIDGSVAKAINNQFILRNTTDHSCRFAVDINASPGSTCKSRAITIRDHRSAGDAQSMYRINWQSTQFCQDLVLQADKAGFRVNPRPVCISSARNLLRADIDLVLSDGSPGEVAPEKVVYSMACGKWRVRGRIADSGDQASGVTITAGGEANPYKIIGLTVDAAGGTFQLNKGVDNTGPLAYNISKASLATALTTLYGTTVVVEGGTGGIVGPLRTRLAPGHDYDGEDTMYLVSTTGYVAPGTVNFGGIDGTVDYTSVDLGANTISGCTGFEGHADAGNTVFNQAAHDGIGTAYAIIFKGTYAPTSTTAPGLSPTAAVPELTVDYSGLTPTAGGGSDGAGLGRGIASLDVQQYATPLNSYEWFDWDPITDLDAATAPFLDCELGYTNGRAV